MPLRESPSTQELRDAANRHVWLDDHDWIRSEANGGPMIAAKGDGVRVTDSEGRSWIDASGGQGAVNIGYGRTEFGDIVYEQAAAINYMPQRSAIPSTIDLVRKLAEITPGTLSRTFPVSSGAEANETAIKVARAYHKRNGEPARYKIISRFGSYHGDLGLVQWLGSSPDHRNADYEPAYPGMVYAPQPNVYRFGNGRPHAVGVRGTEREGGRGSHQVPSAEHGRGGDSRTGHERRDRSGAGVLADAPRDMQRVRHRAHRRRGDDRAGHGRERCSA